MEWWYHIEYKYTKSIVTSAMTGRYIIIKGCPRKKMDFSGFLGLTYYDIGYIIINRTGAVEPVFYLPLLYTRSNRNYDN